MHNKALLSPFAVQEIGNVVLKDLGINTSSHTCYSLGVVGIWKFVAMKLMQV